MHKLLGDVMHIPANDPTLTSQVVVTHQETQQCANKCNEEEVNTHVNIAGLEVM